MSTTCFYRREGSLYTATEYTRGPWSPDHQHGGPVAALLIGAFEGYGEDAGDYFLSNFACEFLKPVPIASFSVQIEAIRGKTVDRLSATLVSKGVPYVRATCVRIRKTLTEMPEVVAEAWIQSLPRPETLRRTTLKFFAYAPSYEEALDGRYCDPRGWGPSETTLWVRLVAEVVEGNSPSPHQCVASIVDAESGLCPPAPIENFTFLNPELTIHFGRAMIGPWLGMQIRSIASTAGQGLSAATLFDAHGTFGRSAQSLVVRARP